MIRIKLTLTGNLQGISIMNRGVTIHQWHGSVHGFGATVRFGSVCCGGRVHVILPAILKEQ